MISLFLILCYFILIFNILVPAISEKMRREREAYVNYKKINSKYICVDNKLFTYTYDRGGIHAHMVLNKNNKKPLPCNKILTADNNILFSCDKPSDIFSFNQSCFKAYTDLFFTT
ncbi:IMV membrane protein [Hypsugopox virus]|nr:IMV membrane protein [Hypsugopox virus]